MNFDCFKDLALDSPSGALVGTVSSSMFIVLVDLDTITMFGLCDVTIIDSGIVAEGISSK